MKKTPALMTFLAAAMLLSSSILYAEDDAPKNRTYEENLKRWHGMSEEERQVIRERAKRLDPAKVTEMKGELDKFNSMPKEEQDRIKGNYQKFNSFAPKEREAVQQKYERFEKMPQERKDEVRRQFRSREDAASRGPGRDAGMRGQGPAERPGQRRDTGQSRDIGNRREPGQRVEGPGSGGRRGGNPPGPRGGGMPGRGGGPRGRGGPGK